jgi:hypothetical protein
LGYADLHIHSVHSHDGVCSVSAILKYVADNTNLDVIAITDHDKTSGLREAVALGPKYGIDVIPGCEITTAQGHLLAYFITQPVPAGLSYVETIRRVGLLGGLCAVPHPEATGVGGVRAAVVRSALAVPGVDKILVGLETFNGGLFIQRSNAIAQQLGHELKLACLGSSDSHILTTIGQGTTEFEGRSAADLRAALEQHNTIAHTSTGLLGARVLGRWAPQFLLRKLGWVAWNSEPHDPIRYVRVRQALTIES